MTFFESSFPPNLSEGYSPPVPRIFHRSSFCSFSRKADIMEHTLIIERRESVENRVLQRGRTAAVCRDNGGRLFWKVNRLPFIDLPTDFRHLSGEKSPRHPASNNSSQPISSTQESDCASSWWLSIETKLVEIGRKLAELWHFF